MRANSRDGQRRRKGLGGVLRAGTLSICLWLALVASASGEVRIKDVARIDGVRKNQLLGYGLVVGLNGTGDQTGAQFTTQTTASLLERLGVSVSPADIKLKNVAAVIVTADLPPFSRAGQRVDATVSSLGDAKSLQGGTLLLTPLRAPNGQVYAVGQGSVSIGGFSAQSKGGGVQQNHPTAGRIPGGALLERDAPLPDLGESRVDLVLDRPDYTTAARLARAIEKHLGEGTAQALDAGRIRVLIPTASSGDTVSFLASLEAIALEPDTVARVVVDERTGTVVLGQTVKVRPVAISHGNLTVQITPRLETSQPEPLSGGKTVARDRADVKVTQEPGRMVLFDKGQDLASLVEALNSLGVSPRDLVAIFQALKAAGALEAELEIL